MIDSPRVQGLLICAGAALAGLVFGLGLLGGAWWAVAIPVGIALAFVLGLAFWVGWTIATVDVEPEPDPVDADTPAPMAPPADRAGSADGAS